MTGELIVPDYVGVLVGWRAWRIRDETLESMMFRVAWPYGQVLVATCRAAKSHTEDEVPVRRCDCGIYAAKTKQHLLSQPYPKYDSRKDGAVVAIGEVCLWGGHYEGPKGWRAQFAYPKRILVPHEGWRSVKALRRRYGVPVDIANTFKE